MNPYRDHKLEELLIAPLSDDVFDRILEILDQRRRARLQSRRAARRSHAGEACLRD